MQSNDLAELKAKPEPLFAALNVRQAGNHCTCPFCKDKTSLRVSEKDGVWLWQCMRGCGGGTVIDALALLDKKSPKDVIKALFPYKPNGNGNGHNGGNGNGNGHHNGNGNGHESYVSHPVNRLASGGTGYSQYRDTDSGLPPPRKTIQIPTSHDPRIDQAKAEAFVHSAHLNLTTREELMEDWLIGKRGISIETATATRLGFLEDFRLEAWPDWELHNAWVLPITDEHDQIKAVKLHFETPPKKGMKCLWVPFGSEPKEKPVHGYMTLWPHPRSKILAPRKPDLAPRGHEWWLERTTPELREKVNERYRWTCFDVAAKYAVAIGDLTEAMKQEALAMAYSDFRLHIERSVLCATNSEKSNLHRYFVICPGELKALAYISAGHRAASITSGEGADVPFHALVHLQGERVGIEYDDDLPTVLPSGKVIPPTGLVFRDRMSNALRDVCARDIRAWTRGSITVPI